MKTKCKIYSFQKRLRRNISGAAVVEFAICVPVLIIFLMSVIEFGRASFYQHSLQRTVHEISRMMIVNSDLSESEIKMLLKDKMIGLNAKDISISIQDSVSAGNPTKIVSVNYVFTPLVPFISVVDLNLDARVQVRIN